MGVVALQGGDQVRQGDAVGGQARRVGGDLEQLGVATDGVDLGDAGHGAQLRLDDQSWITRRSVAL